MQERDLQPTANNAGGSDVSDVRAQKTATHQVPVNACIEIIAANSKISLICNLFVCQSYLTSKCLAGTC
jgi:hypothetical protein